MVNSIDNGTDLSLLIFCNENLISLLNMTTKYCFVVINNFLATKLVFVAKYYKKYQWNLFCVAKYQFSCSGWLYTCTRGILGRSIESHLSHFVSCVQSSHCSYDFPINISDEPQVLSRLLRSDLVLSKGELKVEGLMVRLFVVY